MDDSDVAGPILFFFVFGTSLLVCELATITLFATNRNSCLASSTSVTFMVCTLRSPLEARLMDTGLAAMGTILLHMILSLMSPPVSTTDMASGQDHGHPHSSHFQSSLTFLRSASVLGYCLLPLVLVAAIGIVIPLDGLFGYFLTSLAIMWCAYSSSSMFTVVGMCLTYQMRNFN
jgi:hypothetical protein